MVVPYHSSSIFSGNLVHGAAINKSNSIRFSIDFRVISEKYYDENLNKKNILRAVKTILKNLFK